jgi:ABC-2 type transport system permease protein
MLRTYKIIAFIKRDFLIQISYKMAFILTVIGTIFPILTYFFIGKLMSGHNPEGLEKYGSNYFSFSLIGIAFTTYFTMATQEFSVSMRRAQMAGCLEAILSSQTDSKSVVFMSAIFSFIFNGIMLLFIFVISSLFLGFDFSNINIPSAIVSLLISLMTFICLGIFSGAGTILFKQGEPFGFIFGTLSSLLGGAVFPISVLPVWLQSISYLFPITYSLEALRLSILKGYTIPMLSSQLIILSAMTLILFPISLEFFKWAVEKGKKEGTLIQY